LRLLRTPAFITFVIIVIIVEDAHLVDYVLAKMEVSVTLGIPPELMTAVHLMMAAFGCGSTLWSSEFRAFGAALYDLSGAR